MIPSNAPEPNPKKLTLKLLAALACYGLIALAAALTLDGNARLVVWIFLAYLAVRTYLHAVRKP